MARFKTSQKVISMILTVLMLMSTVMVGGTFAVSAADEAKTATIYFVPSKNWKDANARFAAYFFDNNGSEAWASLKEGSNGMYSADYDSKYTNVIFVRMNPESTTNSWDNGVKWNQTADLKIENQCFTLAEGVWDNGNGTWSAIVAPTTPVTTPVTEPVTTPVTTPVTAPVTEPVTNPVVDNAIYFVPSANWKDSSARFAAYFFDGNGKEAWVSLSATADGKYVGSMPTGFTNVIFTRMNPATTDNNWENGVKWNQTADLKVEGNCFTLAEGVWDNGNGTWTTIVEPTQPVTTPVTVPVTEPVTVPVTEPVTNPVNTNAIYFVPTADWKQADARFAAYFFDGSAESTW
ncbi:MAG: hypothetical protein UH241_11065, partial [Acutalibacteraceae bacterium]|nr:hypothetical protein [Acutalibacteraceae bacterium]